MPLTENAACQPALNSITTKTESKQEQEDEL